MTNNSREIIFFIDSPGFGGSEVNAIKLIRFLNNCSFDVRLALIRGACKELKDLSDELSLKVIYLDQHSNKVTGFYTSFREFSIKLREYKRTTCIVWSHHLDSNRWLQLYLAVFKFKFLVVEQLLPSDYNILKRSRLTVPIKRFVCKRSIGIVICAYSQEHNYRLIFNTNRIIVIPNTRDVELISEKVKKCRHDNVSEREIFTIASIGRLTKQKDPFTLFYAIKILKEQYPIRLNWLGEGELLQEAIALVASLGLSSEVNLIGFNKEPYKTLASADVFVLPSLHEGLPGALIEAMAAGIPCIATKIPGNSELILDKDTGLLFTPGSANELAEAIKFVIANSTLADAMAQRGYLHVKEKYNRTIEENAWISILPK